MAAATSTPTTSARCSNGSRIASARIAAATKNTSQSRRIALDLQPFGGPLQPGLIMVLRSATNSFSRAQSSESSVPQEAIFSRLNLPGRTPVPQRSARFHGNRRRRVPGSRGLRIRRRRRRSAKPQPRPALRGSHPQRRRFGRPPEVRSSSAPGSIRAARRRTSSSSASRAANGTSTGARPTSRSTPTKFAALLRRVDAYLRDKRVLLA